jgi:hypothetical protein
MATARSRDRSQAHAVALAEYVEETRRSRDTLPRKRSALGFDDRSICDVLRAPLTTPTSGVAWENADLRERAYLSALKNFVPSGTPSPVAVS